jgi:hypothetical protein
MHELPIFEIMALRDPPQQDLADLCAQYNRAIAEYEGARWSEAVRMFEAVLSRWPKDDPASYFVVRARAFASNPPSGDRPWVVRLGER